MKKFSLLILLITISLNSFGQILNEKDIYGKWRVLDILEKPTSPQFQPLIDGFSNSTFSFNQNGNFELTTTSPSELFTIVTEMTNGTKWKFEKDEQYINIGTEKDRYSVMGISISEINRSKLFHLTESGITLEVKKVE